MSTTRPKYRCEVDLPLRTIESKVVGLRLSNMLVLDNASHNLVSLGRLAMESQVALHVQASTGYSSLTLPTGDTVPLLNVGVLVIPKPAASAVASPAVHQGPARRRAQPTCVGGTRRCTPWRVDA
eukprot:6199509-Pleurochrysis_carterae.AAC.2